MSLRRPGIATAAMLVALVVSAVACGPAATTSTSPASPVPPASAAPTPSAASTAAPALSAPATAPAASPPPWPDGPVHDPSLLALLPAAVAGADVSEEPAGFAEAARDADFAANVEAAAFPFVASGDDLASGVVARLRSGAYSDGLFRDWRDSYNEGACGQAGGVAGNAETELGGRPVFLARCVAGLLVYHTYVEERDVIVSLFSLGEHRFGEQLMAGLRP